MEEIKEEYPTIALGTFKVIAYKNAVAVQADKEVFYEHSLFGPMRDLRGKWNPYLACGPSWIFAGTKKQAVVDLLLSKITDKEEIDRIPEFVFKVPTKEQAPVSRNYTDIDL